jgi:hypothetical protein
VRQARLVTRAAHRYNSNGSAINVHEHDVHESDERHTLFIFMTRQPQRAPVTKPVLEVPLFTVVPDRS